MKFKFLALFFLCALVSCGDDNGTETKEESSIKINYLASNDVISNPERGFMHHWAVESEGTPLNLVSLNSLKNENVTIINRIYYLDSFKDKDLSAEQLNLITSDFEKLRTAGIKCILRFAYNSNQDESDAPLIMVERHLDQLKPIVTDNADVIAFVQAGFIGSWGEWYYTTNNLTSSENKKAVLNKLLEVFPKEIKIQLRTPKYKQEFVGNSTPMDATVGYGTTDVARIGFHNDCFLASADDYGTYQNVTEDKNYISNEALYVPTGGETCPPSGVPTSSCETASNEMSLLKWTYLNLDYYGPVLTVWRNNGCFESFQKKLGYRLLLKSASLKKETVGSNNFELNATLDNVGYAPVYNKKNSFLVFKSERDGTLFKKPLKLDIRKVIPNVIYKLNESVNLSGIPEGQYKLYLKIEDSNNSIANRTEFSIQLANRNTWDAENGLNDLLHTLTIK